MKPTLMQSTKPVALQAPVVVEQPPPPRGRGHGRRSWRPVDTVLLIGLALSLAILSVSVVWTMRPHLRDYVQAKCVVVDVQQVQPQHCGKLPQCYPGRHVYNDGKTGWCDAIEADEQHREDGSREGGSQDDDNQRQRRSASHEGSDDDVHHQSHGDPDDDTDSSRERPHQGPSGPHGSHEATGPHRRHGPRKTKGHAPDSREGLNSGSDLLKTTTAPGRLGRQGQPAPCTLVTAEVNSRHGDTWKATLYSSRKSADKCSECSFRTCVARPVPTRGEWLPCYYRRDAPSRVFGGHLHGGWSGRRRIACPVVFVAVFLVLLVLRRVYLCCVVPGRQVGFTGDLVYAVPPVDKSEKTTLGAPARDGDLEASAPPTYLEVAASEHPPAYDEALALKAKKELVLTPIVQA